MRDAVFALADCNNFYASCERVFAPQYVGRPVVVLSNNDGCVIARSNEAKALGFQMGDPYHLNRDKINRHKVAVFSSNYALYGDMSRRVMETYHHFCPEVEVYSIDEAFLKLTAIGLGELDAYARDVRAAVGRWTGIPVSVGVGRTKVLAKLANRVAKKDPAAGGVCNLVDAPGLDGVLAATPVGDVWGIGGRWAEKLGGLGVRTALELKRANPVWVRRHLTVVGERIVCELNGESCLPLELVAPPRKGITVSRSFGAELSAEVAVREALAHFVTRAAEKLRREGLAAGHLGVFLHTNPFGGGRYYGNSAGVKLPARSDYTPELLDHALRALTRVFRPGFAYKKCGVMLTDLGPAAGGAGRPVRRPRPGAGAAADDGRRRDQRGVRPAGGVLCRDRRPARRGVPVDAAGGDEKSALHDVLGGSASRAVLTEQAVRICCQPRPWCRPTRKNSRSRCADAANPITATLTTDTV